MDVSRRKFLAAGLGAMALGASPGELREMLTADDGDGPGRTNNSDRAIDRKALIDRHAPVLHKLDPLSPLSVGNGEFAFTADITGLQTFPSEYEDSMPLCTMSQWGRHTSPLPTGLDPKQFRLTQYDTHGRSVGYATGSEGQRELYDWLRENPHRLHLGQIGLRLSKGDETGSLSNISHIGRRDFRMMVHGKCELRT